MFLVILYGNKRSVTSHFDKYDVSSVKDQDFHFMRTVCKEKSITNWDS